MAWIFLVQVDKLSNRRFQFSDDGQDAPASILGSLVYAKPEQNGPHTCRIDNRAHRHFGLTCLRPYRDSHSQPQRRCVLASRRQRSDKGVRNNVLTRWHETEARAHILLLHAVHNQTAIDASLTTVMPDGLIGGDSHTMPWPPRGSGIQRSRYP
jgi:hypothetical protein